MTGAAPPVVSERHAPVSRISMPDYVDWHMILDRELEQLTRPEIGFLSSLGFVGVGSVLGLAVPFATTIERAGANPPVSLLISDLACVVAFSGSAVLAVVCLSIAGVDWYRNRGLAEQIRTRPKYGHLASERTGERYDVTIPASG